MLAVVALCSQRSAAGGVYVAFNTSHQPVTVQLPQWWERLWLPVFDSSKVIIICPSEPSTHRQHADLLRINPPCCLRLAGFPGSKP